MFSLIDKINRDTRRVSKNVSLEKWILEEIEGLVSDFPNLNLTFSSALRGVIETGILTYADRCEHISNIIEENKNGEMKDGKQ